MKFNIFDYFFYRFFKQYFEKEGPIGAEISAAIFLSVVFFSITSFITLNLLQIIFGELFRLSVYVYGITLMAFFICRYNKYGEKKYRKQLFKKYDTYVLNKYFPNWMVWLICVILVPAGGYFCALVQNVFKSLLNVYLNL